MRVSSSDSKVNIQQRTTAPPNSSYWRPRRGGGVTSLDGEQGCVPRKPRSESSSPGLRGGGLVAAASLTTPLLHRAPHRRINAYSSAVVTFFFSSHGAKMKHEKQRETVGAIKVSSLTQNFHLKVDSSQKGGRKFRNI
jgi:hypothetical protein